MKTGPPPYNLSFEVDLVIDNTHHSTLPLHFQHVAKELHQWKGAFSNLGFKANSFSLLTSKTLPLNW
jgi:hypothetical protein